MHTLELYKMESCCGCGACAVSCPKEAITMKENESGFLYPTINETLCIGCYKCVKNCSYQNVRDLIYPTAGYAAVNSDKKSLFASASGGTFSAIANSFIVSGGYVCGAKMNLENEVDIRHVIIKDIKELFQLQGSKYVQSNIFSVYHDLKRLLDSGERVLVSGVPCQISGIRAYLGIDYKNLYTIDIVCHGVPSLRIFASYIKQLENKYKSKVVKFSFRDKSYGWGKFGSAILENGKKIELPCEKSSYYSMFMSGNLQRDNCYSCPFSRGERCSDITLGDYWGIEMFQPELLNENGGPIKTNNGVSAVLVNTKRGKELLDTYGSGIELYDSRPEYIIKGNSQLRHPVPKGRLRNLTYQLYVKSGYKTIECLFLVKQCIQKLKYT